MAGTIVASTLSDGTNSTSTTNCITGSAKAWVNINGASGASPIVRASYNISSVTRNSTGNYTINFTNAFADTNYAAVFGAGAGSANSDAVVEEAYLTGVLRSTTQLKIYAVNGTFSFYDASIISVAVFR